MRRLFPLLLILPGTALAETAPRSSWGKAGVGIGQYRDEAVACGRAGLQTDITQLDAVKTLQQASRQIEQVLDNQTASTAPVTNGAEIDPVALMQAQNITRITEGARPRTQLRKVETALQTTVDQCLTDKGYVRFTLTRAQRERLSRLGRGTPERHAYLHALASDPDVLARQRATVAVETVEPGEAAAAPAP